MCREEHVHGLQACQNSICKALAGRTRESEREGGNIEVVVQRCSAEERGVDHVRGENLEDAALGISGDLMYA